MQEIIQLARNKGCPGPNNLYTDCIAAREKLLHLQAVNDPGEAAGEQGQPPGGKPAERKKILPVHAPACIVRRNTDSTAGW